MNDKEILQKAEEYAINTTCEACNQCQSKGYMGCDKYRVSKQAYIAAAEHYTDTETMLKILKDRGVIKSWFYNGTYHAC